jgi:hypothetical protein
MIKIPCKLDFLAMEETPQYNVNPHLTLEQQLAIRQYELALEKIDDPAELRREALKIYRQGIVMHNSYMEILKHQWGISTPVQ